MALLEAFRGRLRAVPMDNFLNEFQNLSKKSQLAREFEVHEKKKSFTPLTTKNGFLGITVLNTCFLGTIIYKKSVHTRRL